MTTAKGKASATRKRARRLWYEQRLDLYLGEDDHQGVEGQGLDQRQAQNQRQLNAGTSAGIARQSFGRSRRRLALDRKSVV